ncbi:hypothetical protein GOODEAATRI_032622 [Goodea atripinnis]|uniref:Uncharacterized protein n=1 Tax=Goodea atripinnis TaxID=208336 RepID=A0ABV0NQ55_9TELE
MCLLSECPILEPSSRWRSCDLIAERAVHRPLTCPDPKHRSQAGLQCRIKGSAAAPDRYTATARKQVQTGSRWLGCGEVNLVASYSVGGGPSGAGPGYLKESYDW